jgi:divalent metal cation (Fe/Co/Zn/Cd) transporter
VNDVEVRAGKSCPTSLCLVFWALVVILLAFAGFTVIVVRLRRRVGADERSEAIVTAGQERRIDLEQLKGFVYVGAGALALLAIAVILVGLFANQNGRAEGLAVLGFFGYAAYLGAATVVLYVMSRKS